MRLWLALLLLLCASVAEARKWEEVAVIAAAGADLVTTEVGLSQGLHEANPLGQNRWVRIGMKSAVTAGVILLARELDRRDHPRYARAMRVMGIGLNAGAATWNIYATVRWGGN